MYFPEYISYLTIGITAYYIFKNNKNTDTIKLEKTNPSNDKMTPPKKGSTYSAGWDLYSSETLQIAPSERKLVSTGWKLKYAPKSYYLRIAPRSGLACKGIDIGAGVVDADYRGELKVLVINNSNTEFTVDPSTRIAQFIPEYCGSLTLVADDHSTPHVLRKVRGEGGFGSTG